MDIILTDTALRKFLDTKADSKTIAENVSLCGPTFDRTKKIGNETIYEIEAITNRVDTASAQGVARETATILTELGIPAKLLNDPYKDQLSFPRETRKQFHLSLDEKLVIRFAAISLENVSIKPSPEPVQKFLENSEQRPLNNAVDITNELTLLYGMPSHIFDLDKLAAQDLKIRESLPGEILVTLDGQKNTLPGGDIVIEDGTQRLVDLCGVMGGQVAEVDEHTKNILLIVPVYNPKKVRKTSLALQKRTLAAQLYEKQPDPELCLPVIAKALELFKQRMGATASSALYDFYPAQRPEKQISLDLNWLEKFIGISIPKENILSILGNLGFAGELTKDVLVCKVPSWRYEDINIKEDLAEEVARIYGYFRLPSLLPSTSLVPESQNLLLKTELKTKKYLSNIGFHEIYNNSLTSGQLITSTEQDPAIFLKLKNTLSSDFEYLRRTLTPSLLENCKHNQSNQDATIEIYEVANCYLPNSSQDLPEELSHLAAVTNGDYLKLKGQLEALLDHLRIKNPRFKEASDQPSYFHPQNTAAIYSDSTAIGYIGEIKPLVLRNLKSQESLVAFEIDLSKLVSQINTQYTYLPISEYPQILEDITIKSDQNLGDILFTIKTSSELIQKIQYLNSFENNHTFKIYFGSLEKNLEKTEVDSIKQIIFKNFKG